MRVRADDRIRPGIHEPLRRLFLAAALHSLKLAAPVHKGYYKLRARFPARYDLAFERLLPGKARNGKAPAFRRDQPVVAVHALRRADDADADAVCRKDARRKAILLGKIAAALQKPCRTQRFRRAEQPRIAPVQAMVVRRGSEIHARFHKVLRQRIRRVEGLERLLGRRVGLRGRRRGRPRLGIARFRARHRALKVDRDHIRFRKDGLHRHKTAGKIVAAVRLLCVLHLRLHDEDIPRKADRCRLRRRLRRGCQVRRGFLRRRRCLRLRSGSCRQKLLHRRRRDRNRHDRFSGTPCKHQSSAQQEEHG